MTSHPCVQCDGPLFGRPGVTCYWCRDRRSPMEKSRKILEGVERVMGKEKPVFQSKDVFEEERLRLQKKRYKKRRKKT